MPAPRIELWTRVRTWEEQTLPGCLTSVRGVSGLKQDSPRSIWAGDSVLAATSSFPQKINVTCFKSDEQGLFILVSGSFTDLHKYTERSEGSGTEKGRRMDLSETQWGRRM